MTSKRPDVRSATRRSTSLSESAGTRTAMIYAWRYPSRVHRSVMIGVNPPGLPLGRQDDRRADPEVRGALQGELDVSEPHARPRGLDPLGSRAPARALLVPADQEGQRRGSRLLRPRQRDCGRRRADRGAEDDRHAPVGPARRRRRSLVPVADGAARLPARSGLGRGRRHRQERRRVRTALLRASRRPRLDHRQPRNRPDLGRRAPGRRLAREPRRQPVHARPGFGCRHAADRRPLRLRDPAAEGHARAPAPPAERPPGRPAGHRSQRRLLGLPARRRRPA